MWFSVLSFVPLLAAVSQFPVDAAIIPRTSSGSSSSPQARQVSTGTKVVMSNDDGWAVANVRALFRSLTDSGFDAVLSAPANGRSGSGSLDFPALPVLFGCQFSSCPALSPAHGSDSSNPRLNYVNSFPVTSVRYGIQTLAPKFFGSGPEIVLSGPNVGTNLGLGPIPPIGSGTVGAACEAAKLGYPAIAFSGSSGSQVSYTTLSNTTLASTLVANTYAAVSLRLTNALLQSSARPILPPKTVLNVNFPPTSATTCSSPSDFKFALTRVTSGGSARDVSRCGSTRLPTEASLLDSHEASCFVSVSVMNADSKGDVDAATQAQVAERLGDFLTCPPN